MTIGPDIKEVIEEVGVAITLLRGSGDITGEWLDFEPNSQVTKPFIREYFLEAMMANDTVAIVGDGIKFNVPGDIYLLMNKTPEMFENSIINQGAVLYKCNVSGELLRASGEVWSSDYHKVTEWKSISSGEYGLQTEPLFGHTLETDEEIGLLGLERHELYVPRRIGVQVGDRWEPFSGEYYRVESIKHRRFGGVDVVELGEDHR